LFINEVRIALGAPHLLTYPQFDLVDKKELAPLDELNDAILLEDKAR
jgi:MOB kinase activator 1